MGLNCGIVGLPNVGKSTIFKALTSNEVEIANFPFCTIKPNHGRVIISDERLAIISKIIGTARIVPTTFEFVDIAGLVKGASKGEGLGNQFLGHIREVDSIIHVVKCFKDESRVESIFNPISDIEVVESELIISDLEVANNRLESIQKYLKYKDKQVQTKAKISVPIVENIVNALESGNTIRSLNLSKEDIDSIRDLNFITLKPVMYLCNIEDSKICKDVVGKVEKYAIERKCSCLEINGKLHAEISSIENELERVEFLKDLEITNSSLDEVVKNSYKLLNLDTFFSANKKEVHSYTFKKGITAKKASGLIHGDFEKGFIRAEVINYKDLKERGSQDAVKKAGKMRVEGKDYVVQGGDILFVRFNI